MSKRNCEHYDIVNGVCGRCLMPINDDPRDSRGTLLDDPDLTPQSTSFTSESKSQKSIEPLVEKHIINLKKEIGELQSLIEKGLQDKNDDNLFYSILKKSESALNYSDRELGSKMKMSVPTVNRWRSGTTTPYPLMRRSIYLWLKKEANTTLENLELYRGLL
jgi:hypothetical protein